MYVKQKLTLILILNIRQSSYLIPNLYIFHILLSTDLAIYFH